VARVGRLLAVIDNIHNPELLKDCQPLASIGIAADPLAPQLELASCANQPFVLVAGVLVQLAHQKPEHRHGLGVPYQCKPCRTLRQLAGHHLKL
jgi:hypothetical protein